MSALFEFNKRVHKINAIVSIYVGLRKIHTFTLATIKL